MCRTPFRIPRLSDVGHKTAAERRIKLDTSRYQLTRFFAIGVIVSAAYAFGASRTLAQSVTTLPLGAGSTPTAITLGSDGALWFKNSSNGAASIGRITTAGVVTQYPNPADGTLYDNITNGPDGALWFGTANAIVKVTTTGTVTQFPIPSGSEVVGITSGPDGALWFTVYTGQIGRIPTTATVSNPQITEYTIPTSGSMPVGITSGPDGALWFAEQTGRKIGRITTEGEITEFPLPNFVSAFRIPSRPDGAP